MLIYALFYLKDKYSDYLFKSMSESHMMQLYRKKATVDVGRTGLIATSLIDLFVNKDLGTLTNSMMQYGIAQYMLTSGYNIEAALCIREISPYIDLLDGKGKQIEHNQWIQNITNFGNYDSLVRSRMSDDMYSIPIYQTNKEVSNDQKIYIIYGLEFLNDYRHRDVEFVEFYRKGTKLICRYNIDRSQKPPLYKYKDVENIYNVDEDKDKEDDNISLIKNTTNLIYHNNMIIFQTPIMFKLNDLMEIRFRYRKDMNRAHDEIKLKGLVFEPLGMTVMG
jgi:hypothetical protein